MASTPPPAAPTSSFRDLNPYTVFSLPTTATAAEIRSAYKKLALKHHPDKQPASEKEAAQVKFQEIAFAYGILSDEERRRIYDTTGSIDGEGENWDWTKFWREMYAERVDEGKVKKFAEEYKESEEEKRDVLKAYEDVKGDMDRLFELVMLSDVLEDEERYRVWIDEAVENGEVKQFKAYKEETEKKRLRRRKRRENEIKEAEREAERRRNGEVDDDDDDDEDDDEDDDDDDVPPPRKRTKTAGPSSTSSNGKHSNGSTSKTKAKKGKSTSSLDDLALQIQAKNKRGASAMDDILRKYGGELPPDPLAGETGDAVFEKARKKMSRGRK